MSALAAAAGAFSLIGVLLVVLGLPTGDAAPSRWRRRVTSIVASARTPDRGTAQDRIRWLAWVAGGVVVWLVTEWPVVGVAVVAVGVWSPWLLGSAKAAQDRIKRSEALEAWCRRMADTLVGGGAVGLAQAIRVTAPHVDNAIERPVAALARRLADEGTNPTTALREFADALDDRDGDAVAAAVMLALHQQSVGVARVLRQLADGLARDVRARRDIEAARAESRQSIKMLLVIQAGVLVLLALVPSFAAPYSSPTGQLVMAVLLASTLALLVWMRRLALGRLAPRFLGSGAR
ncbi:type II secretion system F family protein [Pseudonocardia sp. MH-G8]|uniref:type II secretion system F family protein n=1 Tax=Pseudonocardia sp. MH-G8 TaxID=1854588 RepID=UPI00117ACDEE|nr:type II secretion system F family protein [Pseudonocardia sp. MH-G8]